MSSIFFKIIAEIGIIDVDQKLAVVLGLNFKYWHISMKA